MAVVKEFDANDAAFAGEKLLSDEISTCGWWDEILKDLEGLRGGLTR